VSTAQISTILVVDDNAVDRERIRRLIGSSFRVLEAATAGQGVDASEAHAVDCVLLDHRLPDREGVDVLPDFVGRCLPVVMLTAQGNESLAVEAMKRGAADYLSKGALDHDSLCRAIGGALQHHRLRTELRQRERDLRVAVDELELRHRDLEASNVALSQREAQLHVVLEQLPALVWTTDDHGRVTSIAGTALQAMHLGASEWNRRTIAEILDDPESAATLADAHRRALAGSVAQCMIAIDDRTFECQIEPFRAAATMPRGVIGVGLDVTERRLIEQRLRQAARLESLGKLSSGIAHDFNNILTAIIGFTKLAARRLGPDNDVCADLDQVQRAADRAAKLIRQLLEFARPSAENRRVVDFRQVVDDLVPMLRRLIGEDISIHTVEAPLPVPVDVDPGRIERVLVNLAVNSRDAMPTGGHIRLETSVVDLASVAVGARGDRLPPGRYASLLFADDGPGIPAAIRDRVFDAFFTTKDADHGTGLGLSTVHGIVHEAGGVVTVASDQDQGTSFQILLPLAAHELSAAPSAHEDTVAPNRGHEAILVVEDEDAVRRVIVRMLESLGYDAIGASDAANAMGLVQNGLARLDLALVDIGLPVVSGHEFAQWLRTAMPGVEIIFMSGYDSDSLRARRSLPESAQVLEKPLTLDALASCLRATLGTPIGAE
jgi:signal transduction histidine kinase